LNDASEQETEEEDFRADIKIRCMGAYLLYQSFEPPSVTPD